jgi:hypothetical protein
MVTTAHAGSTRHAFDAVNVFRGDEKQLSRTSAVVTARAARVHYFHSSSSTG